MNNSPNLTRRDFLEATALAATLSFARTSWSTNPTVERALEHGRPLQELSYGAIDFAPGPHQTQLEQTHAVLMGLDEDGLLRPFRLAAEQPAPGQDLGGVYTSEGGHPFGQWLSALSRYYAISQDQATKEKVDRLIKNLSAALEPRGRWFALAAKAGLAMGTTANLASYNYDKLVCGLVDAHALSVDPDARAVLDRASDAAAPHLPGKALDGLTNFIGDSGESYTLSENQFKAWQSTGEERYLAAGRNYLYDSFFDPLARGINVLPERHGYSHVNSLCSAVKAYLVLGDRKYLDAAVNGFDFLEVQSFVTGGWAPFETFLPHADQTLTVGSGKFTIKAVKDIAESLTVTRRSFETACGSYGHFKLTRYLLRATRDARYGDSMERVMYNAALGALPLQEDGDAFYYSDYTPRTHKRYMWEYDVEEFGSKKSESGKAEIRKGDRWPCCAGTLPQLAADYRISTYFRDEQGIFVNLYIPSTLRWSHDGTEVTLRQTGEYPLSDHITLTLEASKPAYFTVRLRIPAWARGPAIRVNGRSISQPVQPGAFAGIARKWKTGDRIELILPKQLELKASDKSHPDLVALTCGPLVLFAIGEDLPKLDRAALLAARQIQSESPEWRSGNIRFLPWWIIKDEIYTTYHDVSA